MKIFDPIVAISSVLITSYLLSYILLIIQKKFAPYNNQNTLINDINSLLPQTQCGQCNYPGCKPYAAAISKFEADINRCPPGGQATIDNLAELLNIPSMPLADDLTTATLLQNQTMNLVAQINEEQCIGCLLCIKACPVSAIVGANKLMHTVIIDQCTGCALCIAPCPMDCITMIEQNTQVQYWEQPDPILSMYTQSSSSSGEASSQASSAVYNEVHEQRDKRTTKPELEKRGV